MGMAPGVSHLAVSDVHTEPVISWPCWRYRVRELARCCWLDKSHELKLEMRALTAKAAEDEINGLIPIAV